MLLSANFQECELKVVLPDGTQYSGIGIFTQQNRENTFIRAILDGSPAA
jgi:hypothetical protein